PWGATPLLFAILRRAGDLSELVPASASKIEERLNRPFALYRLDDKRRIVRYIVARQLEPARTVEAIEDLEPHVPWNGLFLEHRAKVYADEQHPFAERAEKDRQLFESWN
ncbi:MAG TPA: hypothetical protein VMM56_03950, partial [Planctomycetaceae bacterium]|nr:hypothetical protein [Planctomycetaceae bacterium]